MAVRNTNTYDLAQLIREEIPRCALDPVHFIRKWVWIQHPTKSRLLFDLYPYQEEAIKDILENKNTIVLKARQLGFSTAIAALALWLTMFHEDKTVLVIATKQETAKNLITKVRFAYEQLPRWMRQTATENNKLNITFKNGSQVKAVTSSADAARSEAVSLLILDETAFIDDAETLWISAQATLSTGGKAVLISTPNGMGNFFHQTWERSVEGLNDFYRIGPLTWRNHPERDQTWADEQLKLLQTHGFNQEHEAEFLGSGNTVYDSNIIQEYEKDMVKEPIAKIGFDGNLWMWEHPDPSYTTQYIVSADVARGDGSDLSAFHVIDAQKCEQVAEYKGKIDTTMFAHLLVEVATKYNDALLIVENSNHGWAVLQTIINRGYKNTFYMSDDIRVVEENQLMTNKWNQYEKRKVPGFTTSSRTRPLIISRFGEYLSDRSIKIRSARTIHELYMFIWENGKAKAASGYNDDLVMSMAIGLWVRDTALQIYENNAKMMRGMLENMEISTTPAVFFANNRMYDPYKFNIVGKPGDMYTNDSEEDLRWLLS